MDGLDGITSTIGIDLFVGTIGSRITFKATVVAIGLALDQIRSLAAPGSRNSLTCRLMDGQNIQPIDGNTWHVVTRGPVSDITAAHVIGNWSGFSIAIVLGNKNHRQFPDTSKIEPFMERSLIGSAVTKKADGYLSFAIGLGGESCSYCQWKAATHDPIGAKHPLVHISNMHGASLATAGTCLATAQFTGHCAQLHAFSDTVTMTTVMTGNVVIVCQVRTDSNSDRFFASIKMHEPRNFS